MMRRAAVVGLRGGRVGGRVRWLCGGMGDGQLPHQVLGVSPAASQGEIKSAFLRLAHKYHPDKSQGDGVKFMQVRKAFELLSDGKVGLMGLDGMFRFAQRVKPKCEGEDLGSNSRNGQGEGEDHNDSG